MKKKMFEALRSFDELKNVQDKELKKISEVMTAHGWYVSCVKPENCKFHDETKIDKFCKKLNSYVEWHNICPCNSFEEK